jgi:UDP-glucose 4-epimerase
VRRIALTGTASFLGGRLLKRLAEERGAENVLALDVSRPPSSLGVPYREIDLTQPDSDQRLLEILGEEKVGRLVHMAFFTSPRRDTTYAHELESIGTLALLAAAAAAGVERVIVRSFTAVYGARGQNPNFLTEKSPLAQGSTLGWLRDKLEAERHAESFEKRCPEMGIVRLRFAPLFGPGVHTFYTALFDRRCIAVPMGYDPLVQLLHPEDAVEAAILATLNDDVPSGPLNIVPHATIALRTALHLSGKVPLPVPHPVAGLAASLLWAAGLSPAPGGFVDYARFLFVADGSRAEEALGFSARHSSLDALRDYLRYRHPTRGALGAEAQA